MAVTEPVPAPPALIQIGLPFERPVMEFVRHPRARRYVIRVTDGGKIRVTIPRWGSRKEAEAFACREQSWIDRQWSRWLADRARPSPPPLSPAAQQQARARAARDLPQRLMALASTFGLAGRVTRISVRNQKWRWGSCSPNGHICLNWRLVTMPDEVRDYVLIHELMHLKRMDHSAKFWKLVAEACPGYKAARAELRSYTPA